MIFVPDPRPKVSRGLKLDIGLEFLLLTIVDI